MLTLFGNVRHFVPCNVQHFVVLFLDLVYCIFMARLYQEQTPAVLLFRDRGGCFTISRHINIYQCHSFQWAVGGTRKCYFAKNTSKLKAQRA